MGLDAMNYAAEIKFEAEAKAGEFTKQLDLDKGGPGHYNPPASVAAGSEYRRVLKESNTPERTVQHWQKVAEVPKPVRERKHIAGCIL